MTEVRPVPAEFPVQQQAFIDPKTGNLTTYGHTLMTRLWERSGGFDDDVWRALGLGFTALSQNGNAVRRLDSIETTAQALTAQVAGLRGDPRLATAERAERKADDAAFMAMSRAPADSVRRIEELERNLALIQTAINGLRASVIRQFAQQEQEAQNQFLIQTGLQMRWASSNQALTDTTQGLTTDFNNLDSEFEDRARAALSGVSPVSYDAVTGAISLNASLTSLGGVSTATDKGYYTTAANTWASATLTSFGRSVWALADDVAGRALLSLGSLATLSTINNSNWSGADLDVANGGTGASTAGAARTNLGLVIGTDVQAFNANLASLAGLTFAADKLLYTTGASTAALADFTPAAWASWTPTVTTTVPAGSGFTYTITQARYSKIGRTVAVQGQIVITNLGSGPAASGNVVMSIPFTAGGVATAFGYESGVSGLGVTGRIDSGATTIAFRLSSGAATAVLNSRIWFGFTYESTT